MKKYFITIHCCDVNGNILCDETEDIEVIDLVDLFEQVRDILEKKEERYHYVMLADIEEDEE